MKKILLLLVIVILLINSFGCMSGDDLSGETTQSDTEIETSSESEDETTDEGVNGGDEPIFTLGEGEGTFVNIDLNTVTWPFLKVIAANSDATEEDLYPFVDQYLGNGVSDLSFNIFTQISQTPTDVWMTVVDKYLQTTENGRPVDWKANFEQCYTVLETMGIDYTGVWIDRCHEVGITPWINIRMNDVHGSGEATYFIHDDFYYEGAHLPSSYGYYSGCFDYADEQVQDRMLRYIEEQLMRYDAHLELDFSREMYCFDYINNPDCHEIMTEFLREVKVIVEKAEEKWGHDIKVLIRLIRDIEQSKAMGFDVEAMAEEELVDIVCPTPRFDTSDSDMPIAEWIERFPTLEIYAGVEARTFQYVADNATMFGYAANYLSQGADKIYLYNCYANPEQNNVTLQMLYKGCSALENVIDVPKRYVVTKQDICPAGFTAYAPLPADVNDGWTLEIGTAALAEGQKAEIIIAVNQTQQISADILKIKVNGVYCEFAGYATIRGTKYHSASTMLYKYKVNADLSESIRQTLEFEIGGTPITVHYLEVTVR